MKTQTRSNLFAAPDLAPQTVRVIKANQAAKILRGHTHAGSPAGAPETPRQNPAVRMLATGADYCDLEVLCACGETMQIRCWTSPEEKRLG